MDKSTTTTTTTAPTTTPAPVPATRHGTEKPASARLAAAAVDPKKARLLPAGPWTQAGAAEGLSPQEAQALRARVEPDGQSILLWAKTLPPEGVDIDGVRAAWGGLPELSDAHVRTVMRVLAEHAGVEFVPGEGA